MLFNEDLQENSFHKLADRELYYLCNIIITYMNYVLGHHN